MPSINSPYHPATNLLLGQTNNHRIKSYVSDHDLIRQRKEVEEILSRLSKQPGVILADEVGTGKTFIALSVAYSIAQNSAVGPVIIMVPANLVEKWEQDLRTFCELYLKDCRPKLNTEIAQEGTHRNPDILLYGIARHSIDLLKLLDDVPSKRCQIIIMTQGAMSRGQSDKWIRLALISEALLRHGRGKATRLIQVKNQIHRFLGKLLRARGEERAHVWGEDIWQKLMRNSPNAWKNIYNSAVKNNEDKLPDDPVPKQVIQAMDKTDLSSLVEALEQMPIRTSGDDERLDERIRNAQQILRKIEEKLWSVLLATARWRSPLLIMDEAHHLKNPATSLARTLQNPDTEQDLKTGDGAMASSFDRMLFLTATPFQLGHHELVKVLERFGDVHWDESLLGEIAKFKNELNVLEENLNNSQRAAILLQRAWSRLRPDDCTSDKTDWWAEICNCPTDHLNNNQRAVIEAYKRALECHKQAEQGLRPWLIRHNKGAYWANSGIIRRCRLDGVKMVKENGNGGIPVPSDKILPFFLAARSAAIPGKDLLGEALSSSFEAFRYTRSNDITEKDEQEEEQNNITDLTRSGWYLDEFDRALDGNGGMAHPKIDATVKKAVDLWEQGEKVLVFAFYRRTCRALRIQISQEIERRMTILGLDRLQKNRNAPNKETLNKLLKNINHKYFRNADSPGRKILNGLLDQIINQHTKGLSQAKVTDTEKNSIKNIMRRFLLTETNIVRCFPLELEDPFNLSQAIESALDYTDASQVSWRSKFDSFIDFLLSGCSTEERRQFIKAGKDTRSGRIRVENDEDEKTRKGQMLLANVQMATGMTKRETRSRLMHAFNTPFFPEILVCSEVMGEGVDLQRFCRHVIHHDLAWNPSQIEQRTGRIDRIGCKAAGKHPIMVYIPFLAGTSDERQYKVMTDREQWFRIVMGQDEVAKMITADTPDMIPLPDDISKKLSFNLSISE